MTIDPTREEWKEARERLRLRQGGTFGVAINNLTEAALGCPCPPEPPPPHHRIGKKVVVAPSVTQGRVWVVYLGDIATDQAVSMAAALTEHAAYAREQEEPEPCGHLVADEDVEGDHERCERPAGHDGLCLPHPVTWGDKL